jgi:hypothetical protein
MSISSCDDADSTELYGEYDSDHDRDVARRMEDHVDALDGVDFGGHVDIERDGDDDEEEDEQEEDEEMEDEYEVKEEDEDVKEDKDEDDGNKRRMIGQGYMVHTSADNIDTMVDAQPRMLSEYGQKMRKHTPWPQHPVPAPRRQTPQPHPRPATRETHPLR